MKINKGLKKGISSERIMAYARHFFETQLTQHFREEEQFLFPLVGMEDKGVVRAMREHQRLHYLFFEEGNLDQASNLIAKELKEHIRFEERILFNTIQEKAGAEELQKMNQQLHSRPAEQSTKSWDDPFWI